MACESPSSTMVRVAARRAHVTLRDGSGALPGLALRAIAALKSLAAPASDGRSRRQRPPVLLLRVAPAVTIPVLAPVRLPSRSVSHLPGGGAEALLPEVAEPVVVAVLGRVDDAIAVAVGERRGRSLRSGSRSHLSGRPRPRSSRGAPPAVAGTDAARTSTSARGRTALALARVQCSIIAACAPPARRRCPPPSCGATV